MDWNELMKEAVVTLAAPGEYDMIIDKAEATTYSTGSQGIKTVFMFENGPHAGQKVFNNFVVVADKPQALAMFFRNMKALGLTSEFFAKNPQLDEVANALINKRARITLKHREWNGDMQYDVSKISAPTGAPNSAAVVKPSGPSAPSMAPSTPSIPSVPSAPTTPSVPVTPTAPKTAPPLPPSI